MPSASLRTRPSTFLELDEPDRAPALDSDALPERLEEPIDWERLAPRGLWAQWGRPMFDELLLALTLPPALVVIALVALANAVAFGGLRKAFFVQPRVGHRGRIFQLVKFRTMREPTGSVFEAWSGGDVARVTRMGKFLRSTHLDELPQLFNVLRGEMSFIGPRPEMIEVEEWACTNVPGFLERMAIKPGITGWAQINGWRGETDTEDKLRKRVEFDFQYIREWSFWLDMLVLLRTPAAVVLPKNNV